MGFTIQTIVFYAIIAFFTFFLGVEIWKWMLEKKKELQGGNEQWRDTKTKKNPYQKWRKNQRN